ncbi:DNA-directed RNA polymerase subunit Rpb6 [Tetraselmis virus 1]|uniref:DNA-directed RNA polymerase subunit Rpb6 n=1 Tax=Tetraselmis virus 1 TaxID=2060617 RepID=A0A2P0VNE1_9VIRU|nr:DNA-directed RNA polymerase subunit Rpb6 [Tetraselmis virus 1]AUF82269.1 DNA-directed RNA polymerase subunit Rpb6 [Tetraselmis virus 1]
MPKTRPVITKYELTKVLAARVQQLCDGAVTTLPKQHPLSSINSNPMDVAIAELDEKVLPMKITRELPDGTKEVWRLSQLRLPNSFMRHVRSLEILAK